MERARNAYDGPKENKYIRYKFSLEYKTRPYWVKDILDEIGFEEI